jgi:hypothetical protein
MKKRDAGDSAMQVTIRFKDYVSMNAMAVVGSILTNEELATMHGLRGGFWYTTDVSPMVVLAAFEAEGIEYQDFESISFEP